MRVGSVVRLLKPHGRLWEGKILSVAEKGENAISVYVERNAKGKWTTMTIPMKDVEVIVE